MAGTEQRAGCLGETETRMMSVKAVGLKGYFFFLISNVRFWEKYIKTL